jgi:hypothetical protein
LRHFFLDNPLAIKDHTGGFWSGSPIVQDVVVDHLTLEYEVLWGLFFLRTVVSFRCDAASPDLGEGSSADGLQRAWVSYTHHVANRNSLAVAGSGVALLLLLSLSLSHPKRWRRSNCCFCKRSN